MKKIKELFQKLMDYIHVKMAEVVIIALCTD